MVLPWVVAKPAPTPAPRPSADPTPLVRRVRVEQFRSVREATLDLGRVTVLIGANGSGKSNLLEAIAMGGAAAAARLSHEFLAARGIRPVPVQLLTPQYADQPVAEQATLTFDADGGRQLVAHLGPEGGGELGCALELHGEDVARQALHLAVEPNGPTNRELLEGMIPGLTRFLVYAPEYRALRTFEDEGQILPLGVRGEGLFKHLETLGRDPAWLEALNHRLQLLDWFDAIAPVADSGTGERRLAIRDRFLPAGVTLDQRSANEGFLFLLFVFVVMTSPSTPRFFAIDNADTSLNPKLCARLVADIVDLARIHDKQVLLTTHNPALLDGLDLADEAQRLFVCERDLDGATVVRRIPAPTRAVRLSEAFLRGYLGGLPGSF